MLDRVPKTTKKGEIARTTKVEKAWLILEAQNWAGEVYDLDQAWRKSWPSEEDFKVLDAKMIDLHLPFEKWREFLVTNQDPQHDQIRTELSQYFERMSVPNHGEDNQTSLRQLIEKIGGFPGRSQYGKDVTVTAWAVLQRARRDSKFQKEGLRLIYECRNQDKNENQVELVYFYYLADSITMVLHGY